MASELATNCVQHAGTDFELVVESQDEIRVEVRDTNRHRPMLRFPTPREPKGRGLQIVEAMSDSWGVTQSPDGKTVWFVLGRRRGVSNGTVSRRAAGDLEAGDGHHHDPSGRPQG